VPAGRDPVPAARILDAPSYAWRGLSLDVARTFFTVEEIRRVIDLLELYKLNVLHLHLTDDQAWPLALAAAGRPEPGDPSYRDRRTSRTLVALRRGPLRHDQFPRSTRPGTPPRCCGCGRTWIRPQRGRVRVPARPPPPRRGSTRSCPPPSG
jgi:hypothetical protein